MKFHLPKVSRRFSHIGIFAVAGIALLGYQNCTGGFQATCADCTNFAAATKLTTSTTSNSGTFVVSQPNPQSVNLGTSTKVSLTISSDTVYNAPVGLSIRASDLKALSSIDTGQSIAFSIDKAAFGLSPSSVVTVNVTITVPTMAPSFSGQTIHIDATNPLTNQVVSSAALPLSVNAVYDINLNPSVMPGKENWSVAAGATVGFISHTGGLILRFNNYDSEIHLIHSTGGPIPHESQTTNYPGTTALGMPKSPDGGKTAGGTYANTIPAGTTEQVSQVYCHFHEGAAQIRTLNFNLPAPVSMSPTPTPAPVMTGATYTQVSTGILNASCTKCHSGNAPPAGVDLTTYANVMKYVISSNANASTLYIAVANGSMPAGGPALTATQIQEIQSWINAGAMNN